MSNVSESDEYEIVSNREVSIDVESHTSEHQAQIAPGLKTFDSPSSSPTIKPANIGAPSHPLSMENVTLKTIDDVAGGSIEKYVRMALADTNQLVGGLFTPKLRLQNPGS